MTTLADCEALDRADPLRAFRARFCLPAGVIYLDGNSLGALPAATPARVAQVVAREWGERLIASWNEAAWIDAPLRVGAAIAPLVGARPDEVVVADSTSVNLFKLLVAAAELAPDRRVVVAERGDFPTDLHVARRAAEVTGRMLRAAPPGGVADALDEDVAVAVLSHVHYRTGERRDMAALTRLAAARGVRLVWDLSHAAGAVPVNLPAAGAELAVGCGYKFLNGGPGAPAFLFVGHALQERLRSPIAGWLGHAEPFGFGDDYHPAPGVSRFQAGTPPILSLLALEVGVAVAAEAGAERVWAKSCAMFDLFAALLAERCPEVELVTPRDPARRGSQVSLRLPGAHGMVQALIARGVVGDFRAPDIARFGLTPLYTGFADLWRAVEALAGVLASGEWRDPRFASRARVT